MFNWTIKNPKLFWSSIWEYSNLKGIKNDKFYFPKEIIKSKFLVKSKLNYAENLLSKNDNSKAVTFLSETNLNDVKTFSWGFRRIQKFPKRISKSNRLQISGFS